MTEQPNTLLARIDATAAEWGDYIYEAPYNDIAREAMCEALAVAQEAEFEDRLPEGCVWSRHTGEIIGPVGTDIDDDPDDLMRDACDAVIERYEKIEAEVLAHIEPVHNIRQLLAELAEARTHVEALAARIDAAVADAITGPNAIRPSDLARHLGLPRQEIDRRRRRRENRVAGTLKSRRKA